MLIKKTLNKAQIENRQNKKVSLECTLFLVSFDDLIFRLFVFYSILRCFWCIFHFCFYRTQVGVCNNFINRSSFPVCLDWWQVVKSALKSRFCPFYSWYVLPVLSLNQELIFKLLWTYRSAVWEKPLCNFVVFTLNPLVFFFSKGKIKTTLSCSWSCYCRYSANASIESTRVLN